MAELSDAIKAAAVDMTEAEIVRATDINRVTVRKAMGKDQPRTSSPSADSADDEALSYTSDALGVDLKG